MTFSDFDLRQDDVFLIVVLVPFTRFEVSAATFGALLHGDLDVSVGVPRDRPRPARVTFWRASFLGQTRGRRFFWRRSGLGLVELGAVFGDFQLESALLFFQFLDLVFQSICALLESTIPLLPSPVFLP